MFVKCNSRRTVLLRFHLSAHSLNARVSFHRIAVRSTLPFAAGNVAPRIHPDRTYRVTQRMHWDSCRARPQLHGPWLATMLEPPVPTRADAVA